MKPVLLTLALYGGVLSLLPDADKPKHKSTLGDADGIRSWGGNRTNSSLPALFDNPKNTPVDNDYFLGIPKKNLIDSILTGRAARGDVKDSYYGEGKSQALVPSDVKPSDRPDPSFERVPLNLFFERSNPANGNKIERISQKLLRQWWPYDFLNKPWAPRSFIADFDFKKHDILALQLTDMTKDAFIRGSIGALGFEFRLKSAMWPQTEAEHDWPDGVTLYFKVDKREASFLQLAPPAAGSYRVASVGLYIKDDAKLNLANFMTFATTEYVYPDWDPKSYTKEGIKMQNGGKSFAFSPKAALAIRKSVGTNAEKYIDAVRAMNAVQGEIEISNTSYPVQVQAVPFTNKPIERRGKWPWERIKTKDPRSMRDHKLQGLEVGNQVFLSSNGELKELGHGFDVLKLIPLIANTLTLAASVVTGDIPAVIQNTLGLMDSIGGLAAGISLSNPDADKIAGAVGKVVDQHHKDSKTLLTELQQLQKDHGTKWKVNMIGQLRSAVTKL